MYRKYIKNIIDFLISLIFIILLSPVFLLVSIFSKIDEPRGKIFFTQNRVGKNSEVFKCIKFRSMSDKAPKDAPTWQLKDADQYISKFGKFIRKTSIDEIPQLINILKGDMSFVGPRPVVLSEKELINLRATYKADRVKPGITGLAQISGRDNVDPKTKALFDKEYAERISLLLDVKIFLKTIPKVLMGDGVREGEQKFN